jgi:ribosomal protein L37AE/L43A
MAYSKETKRQNKALGNIISGRETEKRVMVGYKGEKKKKGDIKSHLTEIMAGVRMPWFCPQCNLVMKKRLDNKFWGLFGHCMDCQIEVEHKMRIDGTFENWEKGKYLENKKSLIQEQIESIKAWKKQGDLQIVEPVNIDTGFVHIETYEKDKNIDLLANEALEELGSALEQIKQRLEEVYAV